MLLSRGALMEGLSGAVVLPKTVDESSRLETVGTLAYKLITTLLGEQLEIGQSVVIDCGVDSDLRKTWRQMTQEAGGTFFIIDTICSDPDIHRQRFEARGPTWSGEIGQTWDSLSEVRSVFQPHPEALFVADSVRPVSENMDSIVTLIEEFG
jgi:predicted kinase